VDSVAMEWRGVERHSVSEGTRGHEKMSFADRAKYWKKRLWLNPEKISPTAQLNLFLEQMAGL
jgi:hypothetical protein